MGERETVYSPRYNITAVKTDSNNTQSGGLPGCTAFYFAALNRGRHHKYPGRTDRLIITISSISFDQLDRVLVDVKASLMFYEQNRPHGELHGT